MIDQLFEFEANVKAFPGGGSHDKGWSQSQNEWFGRNRFTEELFETEWSNERLGEVIGLRIRLGLETTLHDASHWLDNFAVSEWAYDVDRILCHRFDDDFDPADAPKLRLFDTELEKQLIQNIVLLPYDLRQRLQLGGKLGAETMLFRSKDLQLAFRALVDDFEGRPLFRHAELSPSLVQAVLQKRLESGQYHTSDVQGSTDAKDIVREVKEILTTYCNQTLQDVLFPGDLSRNGLRILGGAIRELKQIGQNRKSYTDETTRWLKTHASTDQGLVKAWNGRGMALAYGGQADEYGNKYPEVEDNIKSIIGWQTETAFRIYLNDTLARYKTRFPGSAEKIQEQQEMINILLSPAKKAMRAELLRMLSIKETAEAMKLHEQWRQARSDEEQLLPAQSVEVTVADNKYYLEVLGKDDPRGFTIGEDTKCCMTIYGQARSCIEAGYLESNAGFIAAYMGKEIAAQSFWYVHPDHPDTLVIDNIEGTRGRSFRKILHVYTEGLRTILSKLSAETQSKIKKIHIGEGYTDADLTGLISVTPVPKLSEKIYTDAERQRLLFKMDS
jgi:hypothetical protein